MTTSAATIPLAPTSSVTPSRPGFATSVLVELRKLVDTRVSLVLGLAALGMIIAFTGGAAMFRDGSYGTTATAAGAPAGMALAVLAILSVTSELANRSAQVTFLTEPNRLRVLAAKAAAVAAAAVGATLVAYLADLVATPLGAHWQSRPVSWDYQGWALAGYLVASVILVLESFALATMLLNGPAALVVTFGLPMVFTLVETAFPASAKALEWISPSSAMDTLSKTGAAATTWAQLGTSLAVWLILPLVVGTVRVARREIA